MKAYRICMFTIFIVIILNITKVESGAQQIAGANKTSELSRQITYFGSFEAVQRPEATTFLKLASEGTVVAMNNWNLIEKKFACIVTAGENRTEQNVIPNFKLSFYEQVNGKLVKKYVYETMMSFLSFYPLGEAGGNLLTIWVTGSGYSFVVFSISDNKVKIGFENGSTRMPEIIDIDNDAEDELLITTGAFRIDDRTKETISLPETRDVYKWDGNKYVKIRSIPWGNEFPCLKRGK